MNRQNAFDWAVIGALVGFFPIVASLIAVTFFSPVSINGYWWATDPSTIPVAIHERCLIFRQKPFSAAIHGSFYNDPDEVYFVASASAGDIAMDSVTYNSGGTPTYSHIKLVKTGKDEFFGIWRESEAAGRWKLSKVSERHCMTNDKN